MDELKTIIQTTAALRDEQAAIDDFTAIRWKCGEYCPYCGSVRVYHFRDKRTHKCGDCRKRFSIKVGTIFEDSKIPLRTWMLAIWMITSHNKGVASTTLARDLGVTQKTAWFMTQRLRYAIRTKSFNRSLSGDVEIDKADVGGKPRTATRAPRRMPPHSGKVPVIGALERGDKVATSIIDSTDTTTLDGGS